MHCSCSRRAALPSAAGGQGGAGDHGVELGPDDARIDNAAPGQGREAAIGAGDHPIRTDSADVVGQALSLAISKR